MSKRNKILRNTDPSCVQKSSQTVSSRMLPRKRSGGQRGGEQESGRWGAPKFNFDWARRRGKTETSVWKFWHEVPVSSRKRWRARINPLLRPIVYLWSVPSSRADTSLSLSLLPPCVSLSSVSLCHTLTHTPTNATPHLFIAFLCVRDPVGVPVRRLNSRPLVTLLSWSTGLHLCVRRRQRHRRAHAHRNKYKECG